MRAEARLRASGAFSPTGGLSTVAVSVASADQTLYFGVNESFSIRISNGSQATITAATVYGALHAIESFVQLADGYGPTSRSFLAVPSELTLYDSPRFPYRGVMIDPARHYLPIAFIEHIIDSMAANKLNVLHIHFTDDQSFPVVSSKWPKLSREGAFRDNHGRPLTYTAANLTHLVTYATHRGIIIVPEFDMPAYPSAWGAAIPSTSRKRRALSARRRITPRPDATYSFVDRCSPSSLTTFKRRSSSISAATSRQRPRGRATRPFTSGWSRKASTITRRWRTL